MADRMGMSLGPEALDLVKGKIGARGNDQIVVAERSAVIQLDPPVGRVQTFGALRMQRDPALCKNRAQVDFNRRSVTPIDADPWV